MPTEFYLPTPEECAALEALDEARLEERDRYTDYDDADVGE